MSKTEGDAKLPNGKVKSICKTCPHCGMDLSPWQQVLLSVDRALICKECWYRIILDVADDPLRGENEPMQPRKPSI
jgi:DNA-directed RNA polymerase subunit RPC12/RpoP